MADIPASVVDPSAWVDLQELDEYGENLSAYEIGFVESLMKHLREGWYATEKQLLLLQRIREDRMP